MHKILKISEDLQFSKRRYIKVRSKLMNNIIWQLATFLHFLHKLYNVVEVARFSLINFVQISYKLVLMLVTFIFFSAQLDFVVLQPLRISFFNFFHGFMKNFLWQKLLHHCLNYRFHILRIKTTYPSYESETKRLYIHFKQVKRYTIRHDA